MPADQPAPQAKPCPICGRPSQPDFRPFCSKRCRTVDLNRWLSGSYAIPGEPVSEETDEGNKGE